jgi:hypothetical protein
MSGLADGKQVDPAASCPEVDPSIGASDRMSGMEKCQTVKAGVLSRWKSHVLRDMARGGIGSAVRQSGDEACLSLPAKEVWEASSLVRAFRDKGQGPIWVKGGATTLPASKVPSAKRRSASQSFKDWWVNSPLEADRAAVVVVVCLF